MTEQYDEFFKRFGELYGVPWELLKAQAVAESILNPLAVSPHGAQGLAQFLPATFAEWADRLGLKDASPFDPQDAIHAQAAYMTHLHERFGDWQKALGAYNWGMGHLFKIEHAEDWQDRLPRETQQYIARIMEMVKDLFRVA